MSLLIIMTTLLLFQAEIMMMTTQSQGDQLPNDCPPSRCSKSGLEIRYPLALNSSPHYCNIFSRLHLYCSSNHTILSLSPLGSYNVTEINYADRKIHIFQSSLPSCPWLGFQQYSNTTNYIGTGARSDLFTLISCSTELKLSAESYGNTFGPIACLGHSSSGSYVYAAADILDNLSSDCMTISRGLLPYSSPSISFLSFRDKLERFSRKPEVITFVTFCEMCIYQGSPACKDCEAAESCINCEYQGKTSEHTVQPSTASACTFKL